jgi:hypothetical protein
MQPPIFEDACLEILAAQLPNEGLFVGDPRSIEKIRDVNYRVELARKLEAMINPAKDRTPASREDEILPEDKDARRFNPISRASKDLASEANAASTIPDTDPSSTTWPVVTVVIVAAMGLLWLLLKGSK